MSIDSTELPSSSDPSIEADNRKATPRHVARDASVKGASSAFLSTHFQTNYIDRVSPLILSFLGDFGTALLARFIAFPKVGLFL